MKYKWDCWRCGGEGTLTSECEYFSKRLNKKVEAGWIQCSKCGIVGLAEPALSDATIGYSGFKKENKDVE